MKKLNTSTIVKFSEVVPDPMNPRQEFEPRELAKLEASIRKNGILTPLQVEEQKDGRYLLVDGERRYRASKRIGLTELPVVILEPMNNLERLIKRFHLQEQHSQWSMWEKSQAVQMFSAETEMSMPEVAETLGLSSAAVNKYILVAAISKRTAQSLSERKLPFDWISEMAYAIRALEGGNEDYRDDLEKALLDKIDRKVVVSPREFRKYRRAIQVGGIPIVKKIINEKKYSPTMAALESGARVHDQIRMISNALSAIRGQGAQLLAIKNLEFPETMHKSMLIAQKVLAKLVDVDYHEGSHIAEKIKPNHAKQ